MTKFTGFLLGIFVSLCVVLYCEHANAATDSATYNVQRNGVPQFCASGIAVSGNTYNFVGDCGVTPPPPPPTGRITSSNVAYNGCSTCLNRFVGVTEWSAIWGHATDTDSETAFPGRGNSAPVIMNFRRTGYVAAHVHTGAAGTRFGWITHTDYNYGADLSFAWSRAPGDFVNLLGPNCSGVSLSGQSIGRYTTAVDPPPPLPPAFPAFCHLPPNSDLYLNIKLTNPAQDTTTCHATQPQCAIGTANSFGG